MLALGLAQLFLPGLAASRLRARLERSGRVLSVEVAAFPAIELLWHRADSVTVRMAGYASVPGHLGGLLAEAGDADRITATADTFRAGLLTLHQAELVKRGDTLTGSALVKLADLRRAVPILGDVTPLASPQGSLTLQGSATLLGVTVSAAATVSARDGALVLEPDVPFGALARITLFSSPRLALQSVSATAAPSGFTVTAAAQLRG